MSDYHENPLSLELKSLRATVARFQEEAHTSAVKLQRHSLDAVRVHERAGQLERENDLLKAELAILRANPHSESATGAKHVQDQLTLSLRRQTQKTTIAEETIAAKTAEIVQLKAEVYRAQVAADNAYELGARVRGREEELRASQHEMAVRIEILEDDLRMADKVIKEYAALVRGMEKSTATPNLSLSNVREEARKTHDALVAKHQVDTEYMQAELRAMPARLEVTIAQLEAEKKAKEVLEKELGRTQAELENYRLDDATAAKMVARYMQFSQTSTNDLLATLSALKARHEGTLGTLSAQNHQLSLSIATLSAQNDRLRNALDEAGGELAKESYGRRREVALRIRMGRREARLVESLRRWVRGAEERLAKLTHAREYEMLADVVQGARIVLEETDEGVADAESTVVVSGDGARQFLVNDGVEGLLEELRVEMERRVRLETALVKTYDQSNGHDALPVSEQGEDRQPTEDSVIMADDSIPPQVPEKSPMLPPQQPAPSQSVALDCSLSPGETHDDLPPPMENDKTQTTPSIPSTVLDTKSNERVDFAPTRVASDDSHSLPVPGTDDEELGNKDSPMLRGSVVQSEPYTETGPEPSPAPQVTDPDIPTPAIASSPPAKVENSTETDLETHPPPELTPSADIPVDSPTEPAGLAPLHSDSTLTGPPSTSTSSSSSITTASTLSPVLTGQSSPATPTESGDELTHEQDIVTLPEPEYQLKDKQYQEHDVSIPAAPTLHLDEISADSSESPLAVPAAPTPAAAPEPAPTTGALVIEALSPPPPPPPPPPHPLLADLARVSKRYDDLQRAFRDCHLALEGLQAALKESVTGNEPAPAPVPIPSHMLTAAVVRLDDYTEDARVELEIRIGDEVLLAKGFEALLSVPGAMSSASRNDRPRGSAGEGGADGDGEYDGPLQSEVEKQIAEFVAGTDPAVKRARDGLGRKLEDVQHDIAALKRAIFDPDAFVPASVPQSSSHSPSSSSANLALPSSPSVQPGGWSSWIRTPALSRPSSPAPASLGPAPTFGNIMTAPRLRSSPSSASFRQQQQQQQEASRSRRPSFFGLANSNMPEREKDPLAVLGLKVPMPSFGFGIGAASPPPTSGSAHAGGAVGFPGVLSPTSPMAPMIHAAPGGPRSRTVSSTMYMLGLGASTAALPRAARSVSGAPGSASPLAWEVKSAGAAPSGLSKTMDTERARENDTEGGQGAETGLDGDNDSDVE